jgi:hypothetical protein
MMNAELKAYCLSVHRSSFIVPRLPFPLRRNFLSHGAGVGARAGRRSLFYRALRAARALRCVSGGRAYEP